MAAAQKNSLDLLRLFAASLVLFSHQYAVLGFVQPAFLDWTTLGGAGVSIFFFLSGWLVWSSWARDPDAKRFFLRRSLRIFPGLWLVVGLTVFLIGPVLTSLTVTDYFSSAKTWRYLTTSALLVRYELPGVFVSNPYPVAVNGSLWTLPVEFFCYISVALVGLLGRRRANWAWGLGLGLAVLIAVLGTRVVGYKYITHVEMIGFFWWGAWYGHVSAKTPMERQKVLLWTALAFVVFLVVDSRGVERTAILLFAAVMVILAQKTDVGSGLTDRLGDLSYGMYIFAFPVQQIIAQWGQGRGWLFGVSLGLSFVSTAALAYLSWHLVEKQALRFKPSARSPV